jgi:mRNA-degrading endonuclease RelE of RelBE toxin-antitoxin system
MFKLIYSPPFESQLKTLETTRHSTKRFKAVSKALLLLSNNPRHPSLRTHEYKIYSKEYGFKVYGASAENNTPQAYRIFFTYGQDKDTLVLLSVAAHD